MAFDAFERMVAFRYLRARRQEGFVSVIAGFSLLGIGLGVATLIIVMSIMNGFQDALLDRILGLNGHIGVYSSTTRFTDYEAVAERITQVPGVTRATPVLEAQAMASAGTGTAAGVLVRGVRPDELLARGLFRIAGDPARFTGDEVLVGYRLAEKLNLKPGQQITLISPKGTATAFGTVPRMKAYTIAGTFDVGMYEYDSAFVYMPLPAAQLFFQMPGAVTHLEVGLARNDAVRTLAPEIFRAAGGQVQLYDWQTANAGFFQSVKVQRNVMGLVLFLIVLVAAFNIISSLIMLVKDKRRAVAILRTMGASRGAVLRIFLLAGTSIGVLGTGAGVGLGLLLAANIDSLRKVIEGWTGKSLFAPEVYFLSYLPARIEWAEVTAVAAVALLLSLAATLYPSWRAARLDPVELLRHE